MNGREPKSRDACLPAPAGPSDRPIKDINQTMVCGPCGDVVGAANHFKEPGFVMVQAGPCPAHTVSTQEIWPSHDYNRFVQLCQCCGTVPLGSGSRWSTWFCPACREQVDLLNQRLGRYAIPIGRHSMHAGRMLQGGDSDDAIAVQTFMEFTNASSDAMKVLAKWAQHVVVLNLRAIGEDDDSVVPIHKYFRSAQKYVDPSDRFREMCAWLTRASLASQSAEDHS